MSNRARLRFFLVALLLGVVGLCFAIARYQKSVFEKYDAARLAAFASRIADADRIQSTFVHHGSVSVTITGADVQQVVQAVTSSHSDRPRLRTKWKCQYDDKAVFFKGTNMLCYMVLCGPMFLADGNQPPFRDYSGALQKLIGTPLSEALAKEYDSK